METNKNEYLYKIAPKPQILDEVERLYSIGQLPNSTMLFYNDNVSDSNYIETKLYRGIFIVEENSELDTETFEDYMVYKYKNRNVYIISNIHPTEYKPIQIKMLYGDSTVIGVGF